MLSEVPSVWPTDVSTAKSEVTSVASTSAVRVRLLLALAKLTDGTLAADAINFPRQLVRVVNMTFNPFKVPLIERAQDDSLAIPQSTQDKTT